eukprot:1406502-Ditylum_brightwellii.AAC.1
MKRHAHCYFGDDATTDNVPALDAINIADITPSTDNAHKRIFYKREEFTWTKLDGTEVFDKPTLIWVILITLKPTRNVGVLSEICAIKSAKLSGYGNNPLKMLDGMELKFNLIKDISGESVFSTKQFTIQHYVKGKKDPFNEGYDVNIYSIIKLVRMHYVNNKHEFEAVDPKDTAIITLTTKLNSLEEKLKNQGSNSGKGGSGSLG